MGVVAGFLIVAAAVLVGEVQLARRGPRLAERDLTYPDTGTVTAVWIGDSTAVGVGASAGEETVASRVAAARHERVVMLGVSGATVAEVADGQAAKVGEADPDVIYVSVGANDVTHLTSRKAFRHAYRRLLDGLPPGVEVVVLGVPDMGAPTRLAQPLRAAAGMRGRQLDREVRRAARHRPGTVHVDIAGLTGPGFRRDPSRYFSADRFHPSGAGYELWADAVLDTVHR